MLFHIIFFFLCTCGFKLSLLEVNCETGVSNTVIGLEYTKILTNFGLISKRLGEKSGLGIPGICITTDEIHVHYLDLYCVCSCIILQNSFMYLFCCLKLLTTI